MSSKFLKIAVCYALLGIAMGLQMGMNHDFTNRPVHVHVNLLGWVSMAVMAACYQLFPALARSPLASAHFWLHNVGLPVMMLGLYLMFHGLADLGGALTGVGSITVALGFGVFALNVWLNAEATKSVDVRWVSARGMPQASLDSSGSLPLSRA